MSSQWGLMRERRFYPLFFTQFLGAFNDNAFKTALITLLTFRAGQLTSADPKLLATVLPGLFILPFFLFSATSGLLADKLDKAALARAVKVFEIGVMALAAWGFLTNGFWELVAALFFMGIHSALFGPVKYGYLPQHLRPQELIGGNGLIEMGTFVAILIGEVLGAWLVTAPHGNVLTSVTLLGLAVLGYLASRGIPVTPPVDPALRINWNPLTETWRNLRFAHGNRTIWLSLLGISWFWFYGATLLAQFPTYARDVLGGNESVFILLLGTFSVGIGIGSLACERLSGHKVEIGLVPFGAIGLTLFGVDLFFATPAMPHAHDANVAQFAANPAHWRLLGDLALLGLFGGFYIVPMYALIQTRSEKSHQSRVIAANNILNALFMVVSALVSVGLFALGLSVPQLFLATALFNAAVAAYIYGLVPEFLHRFLAWLLVSTVYRREARGIGAIPDEGPAVLLGGRAELADLLAVTAATHRPIRFVVDPATRRGPMLRFLLRESGAIPVQASDPERAIAEIARALDAGDLVCVFAGENALLALFEADRGDDPAPFRLLGREEARVVLRRAGRS